MFQLLRLPFCFQLTAMDPCCSHHDESVNKILRTSWRISFTFYQTITFQVHCLTKRFGTHQAENALWPCHRSEHYQRYHLSLATKLMKDCLFHCVWKYNHKFQIRRSNENNKGFFSYSFRESYDVGTCKDRLVETIITRTHNICV